MNASAIYGCSGETRARPLDRRDGFLCGAPVLISVSVYRALHLLHHAYGHTERDPNDIETVSRKGIPLLLLYYALLVAGTILYLPHVAIEGLKAAHGRERARITLEYAAILSGLAAAWALLPTGAMVRLWLIPLVIAAQVTNLRSPAEHGLTSSGSPFTASRSVRSNALVRFVFCNLNYHLEHHLFPSVPWYNLPRVHELLRPEYRRAGASIYGSYAAFLVDFFRASWAGLVPDVRLLPSHLRDDFCA